jgi:CDP-glucose 4,6-dehydratase
MSAFWRNRRVLVTGHTGFKGSWLCLWLERMGANVVGYALDPPTTPSLFESGRIAASVQSIRGDVRDTEHLTRVLREQEPAIVFHMAAQSVVKRSYEDPVESYSTNVVGTACVFQAVRNVPGHRAIVNVTTDKCYKNREWIWGYRESDELGGRDPYSNSKACAELVTESFRESFFPRADIARHGVALATARAGNVIGGGDWTRDQLVPDAIRAFIARKPVEIRQPSSTRPWQHVLDCLSGYVLLAEKLSANGADFGTGWNFGPRRSDVKPVSWIVDSLVRVWGDGASWHHDRSHHPHEARMLRLDSTAASELLGWRPRLDLPTALDWTARWYKAHHAGTDARELCERQIADYERLGVSTGA